MTNVNPNSRAQFTGSDGRLTKYGMDIIADIYRALGLSSGNSVLGDISAQLSEVAAIPAVVAKNAELAARIEELSAASPEMSVFMAHIARISSAIESLNAQLPETAILLARISSLEARINDLERDSVPAIPDTIFQRLNDIEAQLCR